MIEHPPQLATTPSTANIFKLVGHHTDGSTTEADGSQTHFQPSYVNRGEWLADAAGSRSKVFKPCSHLKVGTLVLPNTYKPIYACNTLLYPEHDEYTVFDVKGYLDCLWPTEVFGEVAYPYGTASSPDLKLKPLWTEKPGGFRYVNDPPDLDTLIEDSVQAMLPGIKQGMSAINNYLELKDFSTLGSTASKIALVGKLLKKRKYGKKTLRHILHASADSYLQLQFNFLPLLSDIANTGKLLAALRPKITRILNEERIPRYHHFRRDVGYLYEDSIRSTGKRPTLLASDANLDGSYYQTRTVSHTECMFHASMKYSYTLNSWERTNTTIASYLDAVGVNFNPAIIWNAMPWSFVVDWFLNVSQFLDALKGRLLEPRCVIHDYCWSIRVKRRIDCDIGVNISGFFTRGTVVPVSRITEEAYKRQPHVPDIFRALRVSGLSLKEFSLAGALATSSGHHTIHH